MIIFSKLRWKNFLSAGNSFTEIDFLKSKLTILTGDSGSGKSTLLDALSFCLYNKPYRNINKNQLVNSVNNKACLVECEFSNGTNEYIIRRGIKPNIFEIIQNGVLINQDAASRDYQEFLEATILKFNYKSFIQIVLVGASNFTSFLNLKPADRRVIIEDLLDIEIFSKMALVLKHKYSILKNEINGLSSDIELSIEKKKLHSNALQTEKNKQTVKLNDVQSEIKLYTKQIEEYETKRDELTEQVKVHEAKLTNANKLTAAIGSLHQKNKSAESTIRSASTRISWYESNTHCDTCKQEISSDFKQQQIDCFNSKIDELKKEKEKAEEQLKLLYEKNKIVEKIVAKVRELNSQISTVNSQISTNQKSITRLQKEIETTKVDSSVERIKKEIEILDEQLVVLSTNRDSLLEEKANLETCAMILKDGGIKSQIIKQYVPVINKYVNKFLESMNFFIGFEIDENFNDTIKYRGRDEFSYGNLSEGEAQRVNLALLFTWRIIAKLKSSVNTNLLILDEVFDSFLDTSSTESVISVIRSKLFNGTNIIVISHKDTIVDRFDRNIKFKKSNNFGVIEYEN